MKLRIGQFDIEKSFLFADLGEEIYMKVPEGYAIYMLEVCKKIIEFSTHVLLREKAIYGLVQAAR
jgi:hypothetical protein